MINVFLDKIFNSLPDTLAILIVVGFSLLALFIALIITLILIRLILRIKWKSQTVKRFIRIRNDGNVNEKFLIRFNLPEDEFKYQCSLEGIKLLKSSLVQKELIVNSVSSISPTGDNAQKSTFSAVSSQPAVDNKQVEEKDETKKKLEESAKKAKDKTKKGLGLIRLVSGILGSLGSLIPGSVGKSFKEKSGELQKTSQDASAKMQMPDQKLRSVEQLKGQVSKVNPNAKPPKDMPAKAIQSNSNQMITEDVNNVAVNTVRYQNEEVHYREIPLSNYYETPSLCPGDHFNVELIMEPKHPYRTEKYSIEVFVRQFKNFSENLVKETSEIKSNFNFSIKGLSPIFWILSFLLVLCIVVINSTWTVLFISWLARFVV